MLNTEYFTRTIYLIRHRHSIADDLEDRRVNWYFSKAGQAAFQNATTPAQRTLYFYRYIKAFDKSICLFLPQELLFKTAFIIAQGICDSSLPYAKYPEILQEEHNPLLHALHTTHLEIRQADACAKLFLSELTGEMSMPAYDPNDTSSALYRLQRLIVWVFYEKKNPSYGLQFGSYRAETPLKDLEDSPEIKELLSPFEEKPELTCDEEYDVDEGYDEDEEDLL